MTRAAWLALLVAFACKGEPEKTAAAPPPPSGSRDAAPPGAPEKGPAAKPDGDQAPNQADREEAEALLAAWLAAQSGGDFAGYQKLYGDRFTGVRRSGKQVRRFDRAGWMKDRGRMFEKPMAVTAEAVNVIAHGAQTHLFFTQTFEQGTYKDTGRKWMALERAGGPLRIAREEMLDSTMLAKQSQVLAGASADSDVALAPGEIQLGWTGKHDKLYLAPMDGEKLLIGRASGSIGTGPITVVDHTFDSASGAVAGVSATRAVDAAKLPKPLADRLGKTVQLLDRELEPVCHAKVTGYSLRVIDWAPEKASGSPEEAAAALFDEAPVVVADLQLSGCPKTIDFGRDVDLPKLPGTSDFDLGDEEDMQSTVKKTYPEEPAGPDIAHVAGDRAHALAMGHAHTEDSCETQEEYQSNLFMMTRRGKRKWEALRLASYSQEDLLYLGVDADRDGTIDVFTQRGVHRGAHSDFWDPDLRVFWPPGLGCDGCEGEGCGD